MSSLAMYAVVIPALLLAALLIGFLIYVAVRYSPIVARIFEAKPMFLPQRAPAEEGAEVVRFRTDDGRELVGSYLPARTPQRTGVVVFCHEFLSDRWSCRLYADRLRDSGFDLFSFDFRNHGDSEVDPGYHPVQWVTDRDVTDLRSALRYLRERPDADPAGIGLFGISRGGGAALCVAAQDPAVWGVVTDGAFPTKGTMVAYIVRWAEIYVGLVWLYNALPLWIFRYLARIGRLRTQWKYGLRFPDVERAVARLAPRPWLMIHGEKDAYIGPEIARRLFAHAGEPKELWIVPKAKHNRCREVEPDAYADRIVAFFRAHGPRRPAAAAGPSGRDEEPAPAPRGAAALPLSG